MIPKLLRPRTGINHMLDGSLTQKCLTHFVSNDFYETAFIIFRRGEMTLTIGCSHKKINLGGLK